MRRLLFFCSTIYIFTASAFAQQAESIEKADPFNVRQRKALSLMPTYQSWKEENGRTLTQLSNTLQLSYQVGDQVSVSVRNSQANSEIASPLSSSSIALPALSGITDSQLLVGYRLKDKPILFNVALNLPTGKKALTVDELTSSILLSSQVLNLRVPHYGQGLGALVGFSAAFPMGETFVLGGGASYQYNGEYQPLASTETLYKPGAEIAADVGFNVLFSPQSMLSTDVIYTNYSTDTFGGQTVFQIGNKITANAHFRQKLNENEFSILARYRSRSKSQVPVYSGSSYDLQPTTENTNPSFIALHGEYQWKLNDKLTTSFTGKFQKYQQAEALFSGASLVGLGIQPELTLSDKLSIPLFVEFASGSYTNVANASVKLTNLNAGIGVYVSF